MSYPVIVSKRAARELGALSKEVISRVDRAILALAEDPCPPGCKKLKGILSEGYRVRVGDYRILYVIDDASHTVSIYRVGHRRDVYE